MVMLEGRVRLGPVNSRGDVPVKRAPVGLDRHAFVQQDLLDLGHRRVALVNGPTRVSWCAQRRKGAVLAVSDRGLDPTEVILDVVVEDLTVEQGTAVGLLGSSLNVARRYYFYRATEPRTSASRVALLVL